MLLLTPANCHHLICKAHMLDIMCKFYFMMPFSQENKLGRWNHMGRCSRTPVSEASLHPRGHDPLWGGYLSFLKISDRFRWWSIKYKIIYCLVCWKFTLNVFSGHAANSNWAITSVSDFQNTPHNFTELKFCSLGTLVSELTKKALVHLAITLKRCSRGHLLYISLPIIIGGASY